MEAIKKILRTPTAFVLLLVAIITLIGTIIKGEFDKSIARIPIDATLTAEARLTEKVIVSGVTQEVNITETQVPISPPTLTSNVVATSSQCQNIQQPICAKILPGTSEEITVCSNNKNEVKLGSLENLIGQAILNDDQICSCKWEVKNQDNTYKLLKVSAQQRCSFSLELENLAKNADNIVLRLTIEGYPPQPFVIKILD